MCPPVPPPVKATTSASTWLSRGGARGDVPRRSFEEASQLCHGAQDVFIRFFALHNGKNFVREEFAELDSFLVEGIDIPRESLEHHLVLVMREKGAPTASGLVLSRGGKWKGGRPRSAYLD